MKNYMTPNFEAIEFLTDDIMTASSPFPAFEGMQDRGMGESASLREWLN